MSEKVLISPVELSEARQGGKIVVIDTRDPASHAADIPHTSPGDPVMNILHLDSSILGAQSVSRGLTRSIVDRQRALHPTATVIHRDLAATPPHLTGAHMAAWKGAAVTHPALKADLATGDTLIEELIAADILAIGAPMYNFSPPTQLKAWIDRVCVAGRTFRYTANGPESLLPKGKQAFIASSRGSLYGPGTQTQPLDPQQIYLRHVLSFLGITDVTVIRAEGLALPDNRDTAIGTANQQITALAA